MMMMSIIIGQALCVCACMHALPHLRWQLCADVETPLEWRRVHGAQLDVAASSGCDQKAVRKQCAYAKIVATFASRREEKAR